MGVCMATGSAPARVASPEAGHVVGAAAQVSTPACLLIAGLAGALAWMALPSTPLLWPLWLSLVWAPLAEECIFRAGLQESLLQRRIDAKVANLVAALAFGLAHALLRGEVAAVAAMLPALLIGTVYDHWRGLRWCVALHAGMNAAWLAWHSWLPAGA